MKKHPYTRLPLSPAVSRRLRGMISCSRASDGPSAHLRFEPIRPSVFLAALAAGQMSRVRVSFDFDEDANAVTIVVRERARPGARRPHERRMPAVTLPESYAIGLDAESGAVVLRPWSDATGRRVH